MMTPSTMYKGSEEDNTELIPLKRTDIPPAGSPLFWIICAPAVLPCKAANTFPVAPLVNSSAFTLLI